MLSKLLGTYQHLYCVKYFTHQSNIFGAYLCQFLDEVGPVGAFHLNHIHVETLVISFQTQAVGNGPEAITKVTIKSLKTSYFTKYPDTENL